MLDWLKNHWRKLAAVGCGVATVATGNPIVGTVCGVLVAGGVIDAGLTRLSADAAKKLQDGLK